MSVVEDSVILPSEIVASDNPYVDFSFDKTSLTVESPVIPLSAEPLTLKSVIPNSDILVEVVAVVSTVLFTTVALLIPKPSIEDLS